MSPLVDSVELPLKLIHENASMKAPREERTRDVLLKLTTLPSSANLWRRGPTIIAPVRAALPPTRWTMQLPAKSTKPCVARNPSAPQPQWTMDEKMRLLRIADRKMYTSTLILSATPPLMMVVVVIANVKEWMKEALLLILIPPHLLEPSWETPCPNPKSPVTPSLTAPEAPFPAMPKPHMNQQSATTNMSSMFLNRILLAFLG
mmetsp:Transcript_8914/g.17895  ORF Transcript_8914/g.17895 Transcript_8914/m.17895 type:complete len:204 (-) Transcript_8914:476-1087(-)